MRVLFDHQIFSYQAFGGASRYYAELMASFHRAGEPDFELGVAESPNAYLAKAAFYRGKVIEKSTTAGFFRTYARNEVATYRAARRQRHDILHATFYDPGVLRNVRGAKLVVTILDMIPERFPEFAGSSGWYRRWITQRWIDGKRELCARADKILAISEHTKQDLVSMFGIEPHRIEVTHLGTSLSIGETAPPRPDGLPARYVLFVGTRNTYKNFELFAEACAPVLASHPDLGVVCIGGGAFTPEERSLLDRLGIAARVIQRSVSDAELAACYAHAAVFVFPSRYEGFGIPILEAFACGCPAVLADASCFPEIAGDAALYFDPDDRDGLSARLEQVLADPSLVASQRAKGKARVARFTWDETARLTHAAYRAAVGRGAEAAAS